MLADFRSAHGYAATRADLLTPPVNQPKLGKSERRSYSLMLTPSDGVGIDGIDLCPLASPGCKLGCLGPTAGKGRMSSVRKSRNVRTIFMVKHPQEFAVLLMWEIIRTARRESDPILVRLNCVSDIRWELAAELLKLCQLYSPDQSLEFYDYTAWTARFRSEIPGLYSLTYSRKETGVLSRESTIRDTLASGGNVAVVFDTSKGEPLPTEWLGMPVLDGTVSDDRTADMPGHIVGLRALGDARKDTSGFVVTT